MLFNFKGLLQPHLNLTAAEELNQSNSLTTFDYSDHSAVSVSSSCSFLDETNYGLMDIDILQNATGDSTDVANEMFDFFIDSFSEEIE